MYGDGAINYSTVTRRVKRINDGQEESAESDLCDRPRSGRPSSAHSSVNIDQADALVEENRRITINELAKSLEVSAGSAVKIIDSLGYSKAGLRTRSIFNRVPVHKKFASPSSSSSSLNFNFLSSSSSLSSQNRVEKIQSE